MFLRTEPELKLQELPDLIDVDVAETVVVRPSDVEVHLDDDVRTIRLKPEPEAPGIEVGVAGDTLKAFAGWLDIPYKFLERVDRDLQQTLVSSLLEKSNGQMAVTLLANEAGVATVRDASIDVVSPKRYVEVAARVISPEADVVEFHCTPDTFHLDVVAPEGFERGWGGDPGDTVERPDGRRVGDITGGGLRIGQDRNRNLAPWVQPFLYRLACTNGYETFDGGLKVDARGASPVELLAALEDSAMRAFARVGDDIEAFYRLREEAVADPSQAVLRLGRERGLPDRVVMGLVEAVPASIGENGGTMFDVVNLVTNAANDPSIRNRLNVRRRLERAGGETISEHAERCIRCASKLN